MSLRRNVERALSVARRQFAQAEPLPEEQPQRHEEFVRYVPMMDDAPPSAIPTIRAITPARAGSILNGCRDAGLWLLFLGGCCYALTCFKQTDQQPDTKRHLHVPQIVKKWKPRKVETYEHEGRRCLTANGTLGYCASEVTSDGACKCDDGGIQIEDSSRVIISTVTSNLTVRFAPMMPMTTSAGFGIGPYMTREYTCAKDGACTMRETIYQ